MGNPPLRVDLYVFGHKRAAAPGFSVEVCAETDYTVTNWLSLPWRRQSHTLAIGHSELRRLADGLPVLTKLSATLTPAQMATDAWREWQPFARTWKTLWTAEAAWQDTLNAGVSLLMAGLVVTAFSAAVRRSGGLRFLVLGTLASVVGAALVTVSTYARLPQTMEFSSRGRGYDWYYDWRQFAETMKYLVAEATPPALAPDVETRLRRQLAGLLKERGWGHHARNPVTGAAPKEEDSPGNYVIRRNDGRWEVIWFDPVGAEHVVPVGLPAGPPRATGNFEEEVATFGAGGRALRMPLWPVLRSAGRR